MIPSRIRLSATSATEQKILLARIYQAIFVFKMALENLVPEDESIDTDHKNNQGSGHGD